MPGTGHTPTHLPRHPAGQSSNRLFFSPSKATGQRPLSSTSHPSSDPSPSAPCSRRWSQTSVWSKTPITSPHSIRSHPFLDHMCSYLIHVYSSLHAIRIEGKNSCLIPLPSVPQHPAVASTTNACWLIKHVSQLKKCQDVCTHTKCIVTHAANPVSPAPMTPPS